MGQNIINMAEEEFSNVLPQKNINFDNHPQKRQPLWKSKSLMEKFQHVVGAQDNSNINDYSYS